MDNKTEFLRCLFEQIESQVQFGDSKASLLIAGDAILLAICGGLIKMASGCEAPDFSVSCMVLSPTLVPAVVAAGFLLLSLCYALLAARPAEVIKDPRPELFLVSHIAEDRSKFVKRYEEAWERELVKEALVTIHGKAEYATKKFRLLKHAIHATLASLAFMAASPSLAIAIRIID